MSHQKFVSLQKSSNIGTTIEPETTKLPRQKGSQPYYRSQAFTANIGVNPLIATAYPLLTIAARLCETPEYSDTAHLYQMLVHEIRVFENNARNKGYRQNVIIIARYFLCVLLDETIIQSSWGKHWEHCSLQAAFHHEGSSEEHVFDIIERLLQHAAQYLELLELSYLCLSFGLANPNQQGVSSEFLEKLDKIYQSIREERGEITRGFLANASHGDLEQKKQKTHSSLPLTLLILTGIIIMAYGFFLYEIKLVSDPLTQQLWTFSGN